MQEMLFNAHLAYLSNRMYVFGTTTGFCCALTT